MEKYKIDVKILWDLNTEKKREKGTRAIKKIKEKKRKKIK